MSNSNFILLYVRNASESAAFYERLLGHQPVEASPTFAMFQLDSGLMLGLWRSDGVVPAATPAGGFELAFAVASDTHVRERFHAWEALGLQVLQEPTQLDFGFTFLAVDPDGHRLRVFAAGSQ